VPKKKPRSWKSLPPEDKKGIVKCLLQEGYQCEAIGRALGTTKNAVVGYQHKYLSELTGRTPGALGVVPEGVLRELLSREWLPEETVSKEIKEEPPRSTVFDNLPERIGGPPPPRYKIASNEAMRCKYSIRCEYEHLSDSDLCALHDPRSSE
jgi:hypothetical protein